MSTAARTRSGAGSPRARRGWDRPSGGRRSATPGARRSASVRSLLAPGRVEGAAAGRGTPAPSRARPASGSGGTAPAPASPRRVSSTSGSRSSSAARRLTKVVFAWRIVGGSSSRSRLKASFSAAIAPKAWFAFEVSSERSSPRSASASKTFEPVTRNCAQRLLVAGQLGEQPLALLEAGREVLVGRPRGRAVAGVDRRLPLDEVPQAGPGARVERVEELVEVDRGGGPVGGTVAPSGISGSEFGPGRDRDVAVGDPRERGRANRSPWSPREAARRP